MQEENPVFREGTYHLMTLAEYSRPNRVGYANQAASCNAPVKVGWWPRWWWWSWW